MWGRGGCSLECIFLMMMMMMMLKRCKSLGKNMWVLAHYLSFNQYLKEKNREFDGKRVPLDFR